MFCFSISYRSEKPDLRLSGLRAQLRRHVGTPSRMQYRTPRRRYWWTCSVEIWLYDIPTRERQHLHVSSDTRTSCHSPSIPMQVPAYRLSLLRRSLLWSYFTYESFISFNNISFGQATCTCSIVQIYNMPPTNATKAFVPILTFLCSPFHGTA